MPQKLAIVGYGKMGRLIEQLAPEYGFAVHARIDLGGSLAAARGADVAVEFTEPNAVVSNVETLAALGVSTVVGTTGWLSQMDRVRAAVERHGAALLWSPNFSIGVNVFFRLVREAARLLQSEPQYGAWAWEIHHAAKKDPQSGTLLKLLEEIRSAGYARPVDASSNRAGAHPGTHEVGFDSAADTITLRHSARSREGFARGALKAAQWLPGKRGIFQFEEILFQSNRAG
ncbi:MAG TPA: dihydrodipicolinate reductase C-terminal domain-containing protein [Bryobacteraceae bacterium]|nr:dihydrodipicolinate reductase C-terminal domain-containing protein [Bryobacteraceae bacterium]